MKWFTVPATDTVACDALGKQVFIASSMAWSKCPSYPGICHHMVSAGYYEKRVDSFRHWSTAEITM